VDFLWKLHLTKLNIMLYQSEQIYAELHLSNHLLTRLPVIEAGYCMSGDDKRHSVQSMILTAEEWNKKRKIHKTRYKDSPAA
jgi:hypothetical protein